MIKDVFKKTTPIEKRFEKMDKLMKPFLKKYKKLVIVHAVHDLKTFQKILDDKKLKLPSKHDTGKKSKYMERLLELDNSIFYTVGFVYACAYEFNYNLIFNLEFLKKTEYYKNSIAYKIYQKIARYWYDHDREYLEKLANKNKTCREVIDKYLNEKYKGKKLKLLDFWKIEKEFFKAIMDYPNKRYLIKIAKRIQNHLQMKYPYSIRYVKDHYNSGRVPEVIGKEDNNLIDNPYFLGFYIKGKIPKTLIDKIKKNYKDKILFDGKKIEEIE